jgi:hypothetical protein
MVPWLVAAVALLLAAPAPVAAQAKLGRTRCAMLEDPGRSYCTQFVTARDSFTKYSVANEWARFATDSCARRARRARGAARRGAAPLRARPPGRGARRWGRPRARRRRAVAATLAHACVVVAAVCGRGRGRAAARHGRWRHPAAAAAASASPRRRQPLTPARHSGTPKSPLPPDLCSGVTALCLNQDIQAPRPNNSSCRVPPEDTPCGDNPKLPGYCRAGVCYCERGPQGRARGAAKGERRGKGGRQQQAGGAGAGGQEGTGGCKQAAGGPPLRLPRPSPPPPHPHPAPLRPPTPPRAPADTSGVPVPSRADVESALLERARAFTNPKTTTFFPQQTQLPLPPDDFGDAGDEESPFGPDLNMTVWVDQDTIGRFVPPSFIGISREYTNESVYWDRNLPAWGAILDVLGPSPIIRLGGASQEALTAPPTADYLRSLVTLHCALGVRYIVGLPLFQNAPALALQIKQAFDTAFANFPRAILSYELGNEVRGGGGCGAGGGGWGVGGQACWVAGLCGEGV